VSKRALILVEGQTEERFVKDVLAPELWDQELYLQPAILVTKRVKDGANFKGGVTNYAKFRSDIMRLLNSAGGALVTTLLDYYGLPADFPGMNDRPSNGSPEQRVLHVEQSIAKNLGNPANFKPFLALHEFEAWLFSTADDLPRVLTAKKGREQFAKIIEGFRTPEDINERPETAPSKRIEKLFPSYSKTAHGPTVASRIGLRRIRDACPHFDRWVSMLEAFAAE
jgi:hypothetical protein